MYINGIEFEEAERALPASEKNGPWKVGGVYHVRTVTFAIAGKLLWVGDRELLFSEACWSDASGLFSNYLNGNADDCLEVEPFPKEVIVSRGAVVDAAIIDDFYRGQK